MLTGKSFRLKSTTLAIETFADRRVAVKIPMGETITVLSGPKPDDRRMIDVRWDNRTFVMFAEDVMGRGQEMGESAKA